MTPWEHAANGVPIKALLESPVGLRKAQVALEVAPAGITEGQLPEAHSGLQQSPEMPCTCTACTGPP